MYAIDRETHVRRVSSFNAPALEAGHNKSVAIHIDNRYDALCAELAGDHFCYATSVK